MRRSARHAGLKAGALLIVVSVGAGLLAAGIVLPAIGAAGVGARAVADLFDNLRVQNLGELPDRSEILNSTGGVIAYYYPENIYRVPVSYNQVAPVMRNAIVAIEDSRYYQHGAFDLHGTLRAVASILLGGAREGGSTLAQQYVKNALVLLNAKNEQAQLAAIAPNLPRKVRELRIAANVEHQFTKNQLLAAYLDAIYFDHQAWGIQVASQFYFSTTASRLTLTQAALLAGMVENPSLYDPIGFPTNARERRNIVLADMADQHYITRAQARAAEATPLGLKESPIPLETGCSSQTAAAAKAAFFCDYMINVLKNDRAYRRTWAELNSVGGLQIRTTMSARDQRIAERAVNFIEPRSRFYNPGRNADTEVLIQPGTGDVKAIAVNRTYGNGPGQTTVDYAVPTRYGASAGVQTGSSNKIFTLLTALKQGVPFGFHLKVSSPITLSGYYNCAGQPTQPYANLSNAEGPGHGVFTLYNGTTGSINVFYAELERYLGLCNVVKTAISLGMTRADGVSLLKGDGKPGKPGYLYPADDVPSFTLGSVYVSPMSMAAAYAAVAARGVYCRPIVVTSITDRNGKQLPVESARCHRVLTRAVADAAIYILRGVLQTGTAYNRGINIPAAAKTGTADGGYYAAFAGFTPLLTGYVSVFNPLDPTGGGAMVYPRADYREVDGLLAAPSQMFGDNAPGATWQWTFLHLNLRPVDFVAPPYYPFFNLGNGFVSPSPPKKHKPSPKGSRTPGPTGHH